MYKFLFTLAAAALLSGCMKVGPDYQRPDPVDIPESYHRAGGVQRAEYLPPDQWWREFKDIELDKVVATVLLNNPDIHQAAAGVMEARGFLRQNRADQFPELNLNIQASRQQQSIINPLTGGRTGYKVDTYSLSLPASFELDLWGRLARATEAARADLLAADENRRTVIHSLVAEAVTRYLEIRATEQQIEINRQLIATYEENLELVEGRYRRGLTSVLDVRQARRNLAQAESRLPALIQSLGLTRHALSILKGVYPETGQPENYDTSTFGILPPVPVGLPSELLLKRPDIRAAEAQLEAASARIGVAKASRFPSISLTGSYGFTSEDLDDLFRPENELWQIATQGLQPLFNAGRLKAGQVAAEARYQQQVSAYAKQLLNAFAEVEGALLTREQQIERRRRLVTFMEEARATVEIAMDRYKRGLIDYLNVLDAQQALYQAQLSLVDAELAIYSNRVRLHRALGGGWENISELED